MSTCIIKLKYTIHEKNKLLTDEYKFMFNKNNFRKQNGDNEYSWTCIKRCVVTFRTII